MLYILVFVSRKFIYSSWGWPNEKPQNWSVLHVFFKTFIIGLFLTGLDVVTSIAAIPIYKPGERIRQYNELAEFFGDERAKNARAIWNRPLETVYISDCGVLKVAKTTLSPTLPWQHFPLTWGSCSCYILTLMCFMLIPLYSIIHLNEKVSWHMEEKLIIILQIC